MAVSIDNYLRELSSKYYLKDNSAEVNNIEKSIAKLFENLREDMPYLINRRFIFGSYDRDTILPRSIDKDSDVDIMVIFNHTEHERTPETYRSWLKIFADKYYKNRYGSEVVKSFPSVTIRLNSINYDLVPAKEEKMMFLGTVIYIPSKTNESWQITDPNDVKNKLTEANTKYNQIVRPIIRLLKAWNSTNSYPFESYELELKVTSMNFYNDNVQSGFLYAVGQLLPNWNDSQSKKDKIESLKYNITKMKESLDSNDLYTAKKWLHRILPG
jgi:predicted nucleotidyltransferase